MRFPVTPSDPSGNPVALVSVADEWCAQERSTNNSRKVELETEFHEDVPVPEVEIQVQNTESISG